MNSEISVAVILLNYHGLSDTLACLDSLKNMKTNAKVHIVVVDLTEDGVQSAEGAEISKNFPEVTLLSEKNTGYSGGNNAGISFAITHLHPTYLLLLNNDTLVASDMLDALLKEAATNDTNAVFSPKIYFAKGSEFHKDAYTPEERGHVIWYAGGILDRKNMYGWHRGVDEVDHGQFDKAEQTSFATGCCILIPTKVIEKVGLLNDSYFLYLEDLEYSERVRKAGGEIWYVPQATMWHKNAGSTGGSGSQTHVYYQTRNRMMFGMKYAGLRTKLALMKEGVKKLRTGSHEEKQAMRDYFRMKRGKK